MIVLYTVITTTVQSAILTDSEYTLAIAYISYSQNHTLLLRFYSSRTVRYGF